MNFGHIHKYFTFGNLISSFTYALIYVFMFHTPHFFFANAYTALSDAHKYFTFGNYICSFNLWPLFYSLFSRLYLSFMPITFLHMCIYTQYYCLWSDNWQSQIFHIWQAYFFFCIYDHLNIPCLAVIFVFQMPINYLVNPCQVLSQNNKCLTFGNCICPFTSVVTYIFCLLQTCLLSLISAHNFWNVAQLYVHITLMPRVLSDSKKYFTFGRHICSFTSVIT